MRETNEANDHIANVGKMVETNESKDVQDVKDVPMKKGLKPFSISECWDELAKAHEQISVLESRIKVLTDALRGYGKCLCDSMSQRGSIYRCGLCDALSQSNAPTEVKP